MRNVSSNDGSGILPDNISPILRFSLLALIFTAYAADKHKWTHSQS